MMLEAEISALSTTSSGGEWVDAALRDHERGHVSEEAEVLQLARTHPPPPSTESQPCKTNYGV